MYDHEAYQTAKANRRRLSGLIFQYVRTVPAKTQSQAELVWWNTLRNQFGVGTPMELTDEQVTEAIALVERLITRARHLNERRAALARTYPRRGA